MNSNSSNQSFEDSTFNPQVFNPNPESTMPYGSMILPANIGDENSKVKREWIFKNRNGFLIVVLSIVLLSLLFIYNKK